MEDIKFAIVIPTYKRKNGKTPFYLNRALESVFNQTYQNFTVFLVGDDYEDREEFKSIVSKFDKSKMITIELFEAKERVKYVNNLNVLWNVAGVNANNVGVETALEKGFDYIARCDDDDWFEPKHLENFNEAIQDTKGLFLCSKANYTHGRILPDIQSEDFLIPFLPAMAQQIHSSICVNFREIPVRYRDTFAEKGELYPADGILAMDIKLWLQNNNQTGILINEVTCNHVEEGEIKSL